MTYLPAEMVERGLAPSRTVARLMIVMGRVTVDGQTADLDSMADEQSDISLVPKEDTRG